VDELVAFLTRCLDEDERVVRQMMAEPGGFYLETDSVNIMTVGAYVYRWPPKRVLAEVKAKRAIIEAGAPRREREETGEYLHFGNWSSCSDDCASTVWWEILKLLAQPYAGQDGWREEWRAEGGC
jgi:hypothetical protein